MGGEYCHLVPAEVDGDDGDAAAVGVARPGRLHQPPAGQGARLRHLASVVTPIVCDMNMNLTLTSSISWTKLLAVSPSLSSQRDSSSDTRPSPHSYTPKYF